jgi:hypothetical protein
MRAHITTTAGVFSGTNGSNPASSSAESGANPTFVGVPVDAATVALNCARRLTSPGSAATRAADRSSPAFSRQLERASNCNV